MSGPQETTASDSAKLAAALTTAAAAARAATAATAALTTAASGQPPPPGKIYKFCFREHPLMTFTKGQLISKTNCQALDSSKKRMNEFVIY